MDGQFALNQDVAKKPSQYVLYHEYQAAHPSKMAVVDHTGNFRYGFPKNASDDTPRRSAKSQEDILLIPLA